MLHPRDKDFVRFIWFKDLDKLNVNNIETAEYQIYRLCHVLFGFSSSPFLLTITFSSIDPDIVHEVLKSLHVNSLSSGNALIQSTYNFYMKCKNRLLQANFTLLNFNRINQNELEQMISGKVNELSVAKILGLQWDKVDDTLVFDMKKLETLMVIKPTKRGFIQFFTTICDYLGLINPFVVSLKSLFQKVCISKVNWDAILSPDIFMA